jgi:hypothetical protein
MSTITIPVFFLTGTTASITSKIAMSIYFSNCQSQLWHKCVLWLIFWTSWWPLFLMARRKPIIRDQTLTLSSAVSVHDLGQFEITSLALVCMCDVFCLTRYKFILITLSKPKVNFHSPSNSICISYTRTLQALKPLSLLSFWSHSLLDSHLPLSYSFLGVLT